MSDSVKSTWTAWHTVICVIATLAAIVVLACTGHDYIIGWLVAVLFLLTY